jgi:hypothetical protein
MSTVRLLEPMLDGGIASVKFFNGRLLSAEDLGREQRAHREALRLHGRSIGDGVAFGLRVSMAGARSDPRLRVAPGVAVTPEGDAIHLPEEVVVDLTGTGPAREVAVAPEVAGAARFHDCAAPATGLTATGRDLWLLLMAPAQESSAERAPVTGLGGSTTACNARYLLDGVRFRIVRISDRFTDAERLDEVRLRSVVAARCFDVARSLAHIIDPFAPAAPSARLVDVLRAEDLVRACEVPLAVFHWNWQTAVAARRGFQFVDRWAVRRRPTARTPGGAWGTVIADAARAEAEALLQQFQEHVDDLLTPSPPTTLRARDVFAWLPPVGVLPVTGTASPGFNLPAFFDGFTLRGADNVDTIPQGPPTYHPYTVVEGARVPGLLAEALHHPPFRLRAPPDADSLREFFWVYQVRENVQATRAPGSLVRPYAIFARGTVPYHGDARYDASRWGYASFS